MSQTKKARFKSHYEKMVQPIFRYLYYKCGDRALAEDLAQDVFVKYWDKLDAIKEGGESAYLYQIAKNLLINRAQKAKVELKFQHSLKPGKENLSPQFLLEEKEFKAKLEGAISELPQNQREVLLMHRIEGMKYKEIAEYLGLSQKAVEKRMHLALKKLREVYENF